MHLRDHQQRQQPYDLGLLMYAAKNISSTLRNKDNFT